MVGTNHGWNQPWFAHCLSSRTEARIFAIRFLVRNSDSLIGHEHIQNCIFSKDLHIFLSLFKKLMFQLRLLTVVLCYALRTADETKVVTMLECLCVFCADSSEQR